MNFNPEQLVVQFGSLGALLFVIYKLGLRWLDRWSVAETERTNAITSGMTAITASINSHAKSDLESHTEMTEKIGHFEGRLDQLLGRPTATR